MSTDRKNALGEPNAAGEWPYDPTETFTPEELKAALELRQRVPPDSRLQRKDSCPHTPPCPNVRVCIEEIAWFLRHRSEIFSRMRDL